MKCKIKIKYFDNIPGITPDLKVWVSLSEVSPTD